MKRSLFFDLDGTLWDAIEPIKESWNETMKEEKMPYSFDYQKTRSTMGLTPEETLPVAFPGLEEKKAMSLFRLCVRNEIKYLSLHPGTLYPEEEKTLQTLSEQYPLYIVSNSDKGYVENYLTSCHMEKYFQGHLCAGDTGKDKHENITYLKKKEGIDQVIYIGDTLKDRNETLKAGELFIHAKYGFGTIEDEKYFIDRLQDLVEEARKVFEENPL